MLLCKYRVIKKKQEMKRLQKYIRDVLGIEVNIKPFPGNNLAVLPLFLRKMYDLQKTWLFEREIILIQQNKSENFTTDQYLKHVRQIEQTYNLPVILVLESIEAYNRKRLIEKKIAFIIPEKQMFIPQLLIDLKEFRNVSKKKRETILPAAQCLLFYHLLKENIQGMNFKTLSEKTNYTQMTITRAATDLAEREICQIEGRKDKQIRFNADSKAIWEKIQSFLQNPVKRKIYIKDQIDQNLMYRAGFSALSYYTNLASDADECFAIASTDYLNLKNSNHLESTNRIEGHVSIEIWKYAPGILVNNRIVDPLSLYLTMKEEKDERVELELEKMIEKLW
jgi:hypothetical protein